MEKIDEFAPNSANAVIVDEFSNFVAVDWIERVDVMRLSRVLPTFSLEKRIEG